MENNPPKNEVARIDGLAYLVLRGRGNAYKGYTVVDEADLANVEGYRWHLHADGYVVSTVRLEGGKTTKLRLHRLLLDLPADGVRTPDHINRNPLDNRQSNLRLATAQEQSFNQGRPRNNTSGVKGVSWDKAVGKWRAEIAVGGKRTTIGRYDTIEEARVAYETVFATISAAAVPVLPPPYPDPFKIASERLAEFRAKGGDIIEANGQHKVTGIHKENEMLLQGLRDVRPFVVMHVDAERLS